MSPSPKTPDEKKLPEDETSSNDELTHPPHHLQNEYVASTDESTPNSDDENNEISDNSNQHGYCLLPQESELNHQEDEDEDEDDDEEFLRFATLRAISSIEDDKPPSSTNSPIHPLESIWSTKLESESFPVDDDKATYIKNLMSKIELPQSSVPTWAQYYSEQDWQAKLRERITCRQTTFFSSEKN